MRSGTSVFSTSTLFLCLSVSLCISLSVCLSLSVYVSLCLPVSLFLSLTLSLCLSLCLSMSLYFSLCLSDSLSLSLSLSLYFVLVRVYMRWWVGVQWDDLTHINQYYRTVWSLHLFLSYISLNLSCWRISIGESLWESKSRFTNGRKVTES